MDEEERSRAPKLDTRFIDVDEPAEVSYWCKFLDTDERRLREAVGAVGSSAHKVREHLKSRH